MCICCGKSKKYEESFNPPQQLNTEKKVNNTFSDLKNKEVSTKQGYFLTNEKNIQKTIQDPAELREIVANAAQERFEKSKNRGLSETGKLSAQLIAEKKKTHKMLLKDIVQEKQAERNQQKKDLQWD
ncbi:hypothetical protein PCANB_000786 [Pneumocystis canis]|nr:hypothetical protein PCANB_000786 [Pneumocystis canis]